MFATGIENSIPTINHGKTRIDAMEVCGHYERWREDFDCVQEIGINFLRYGPPLHKTYLGPNKFDWEFADITFAELKRRDISPSSTCATSDCRTGWAIHSRTRTFRACSR